MAGLYLPHDLDAVTDDKIVEMLGALDWYGYGLYWRLLELLYARTDHKLTCNYKGLSKIIGCDADTLQRLITEFGLFTLADDGSQFWSERVLTHCEALATAKQDVADAKRRAASARWDKSRANADGMQSDAQGMHVQCTCNAPAKQSDAEGMQSDAKYNINLNNNLNLKDADASLTRVRTREEAAAAAEQNLDTQTVAPDVQQLLDAIGKRFGTIPLPAHLTALEQLISECNRPGVVNGVDVVRDGLARLDTAEAIKSGKVRLSITQFLQPKYFTRLISGDYDKMYNSKRKSGYAGAGISFEGREY